MSGAKKLLVVVGIGLMLLLVGCDQPTGGAQGSGETESEEQPYRIGIETLDHWDISIGGESFTLRVYDEDLDATPVFTVSSETDASGEWRGELDGALVSSLENKDMWVEVDYREIYREIGARFHVELDVSENGIVVVSHGLRELEFLTPDEGVVLSEEPVLMWKEGPWERATEHRLAIYNETSETAWGTINQFESSIDLDGWLGVEGLTEWSFVVEAWVLRDDGYWMLSGTSDPDEPFWFVTDLEG